MIRKLLIALLMVVAVYALVSFFLPGKIHIERSLGINATVETVFSQVNTLKSWKNWSYWDRLDPEMKSTYEGPVSGTGAIHKWNSTNDTVGNGCLTITESMEPNHISTSVALDMGTINGGWDFENSENQTKATTYMDFEFPFYGRIFPGLFIEKWVGKDFEKSLAGLKEFTENLPTPPTNSWNIQPTAVPAINKLSIKINCSLADMKTKWDESMLKLSDELSKQGLMQSGNRYTVFHYFGKDSLTMEPGIPVNESGKNNGVIISGQRDSSNAYMLDYHGGYNHLETAYTYFNKWLNDNKELPIGPPWEEYVSDPSSEKDTVQWLTIIYFPVK